MPSFSKIDTSQRDNWCWVFHSAKAVLGTSFEILDIQRCAWDGLLGASQSYKNPWENPFLLSCWHILKMRGRTSYSRLLQQMNLRLIILKWGQNGNPWNGTILSHAGKKSDKCHCQWQCHFRYLLELRRSDSCGCNAERGDHHLQHLHQEVDRTQKAFRMSLA